MDINAPDSTWSHFNEERDDAINLHFPWREMSPEAYAAQYSHQIGAYAFHLYRFRDPAIGRWARRLGEILTNPDEMEKCRREYLTPDEYAHIQQVIDDILQNGL